jgi:thioredoxin 1
MNLLESIKSDKPTLVNFHATWCMPCKIMKPNLDQVVQKLGNEIQYERIDIDQNRDLASAFQISSVPTTILFRNNEVVWRASGIYPATAITGLLEQAMQSEG